MRRFVATVLCGLAAAASVSCADGQSLSATAGSKVIATSAKNDSDIALTGPDRWDATGLPVGFIYNRFIHEDGVDSEGEAWRKAMNTDGLLNATKVERGELICDTLEEAKTARVLRFTLSSSEEVVADRKSFATLRKEAFTDRLSRNIFTGSVRAGPDYTGYRRIISMSWTGCSAQNFQVKMLSPSRYGGVDTTVSHPSRETSGGFLIAKVHHIPHDESDVRTNTDIDLPENEDTNVDSPESEDTDAEVDRPTEGEDRRRLDTLTMRRVLAREAERGIEAARLEDPDIDAKDSDVELLQAYRSASLQEKEAFHKSGLRRLSDEKVVVPSGRVLEDSDKPVIDVLVIYTQRAMFDSTSLAGAERSSSQMETDIAASYQGANDALSDSGVDFLVRVVHIREVDYTETDNIADAVYDLQKNENFGTDVHALRDEYGADLVQLIGFYVNTCGIGFTMSVPTSGFSKYGYSVVHTNCLSNFSHIHELGHNLGANHDKANAQSTHPYSYAYRQCDGEKPFRTIMAYSTGCSVAPRVNVFSNPDVTYEGQIQGTVEENNARVLNEAMSTVVNFRESRVSPTPTNTLPTPSPTSRAPTPEPTAPPTPEPTAPPTPEPTAPPTPEPTAPPMPEPTAPPTPKPVTPQPTPSPVTPQPPRTPPPATPQPQPKPTPEPSAPPRPSPVPQPQPTPEAVAPQPTPSPVPSAQGRTADTTSIYPEPLTTKRMKRNGCYRDDPTNRAMKAGTKMPAIDGETIGMTPENCMAYCWNHPKQYKFFGLENGDECFCRNNKKYRRLGKIRNKHCRMECAGDSTETCGGESGLEVFKIKNRINNADLEEESNPEPAAGYHGCYQDVKVEGRRRMAQKARVRFKGNSVEACDAHCSKWGYSYFALKYGFMCSCGDTMPEEWSKVEDTKCSTPCTSPDDDSDCGGHWHKSIYSVGQIAEG